MSMRYQAAILTASYFPLKVPDAPTIGAATATGPSAVSVTFTAPANIGGGAITGYTVTSSPGNITASGSSSPISVTGLTLGTAYTFTVTATNAYGTGPSSASSNSATPAIIPGQQAYTTAGTYSWVAPADITSVSVVCVGGGAGNAGGGAQAGGGGLGYKNNYTVTPGNSYTVVVGRAGPPGYLGGAGLNNGGDSYFISTAVVKGGGGVGYSGNAGGTYTGDGGGNGGLGGYAAGGGAGGYSGNGGQAAQTSGNLGTAGTGGAGGGAYSWASNQDGGGVGILGQGASGAAGDPGNPGSGGSGKTYGGGAGNSSQTGGVGAVRIIWPGSTRYFPSTNTGDL